MYTITEEIKNLIIELFNQGNSIRDISKSIDMSFEKTRKLIKDLNLSHPKPSLLPSSNEIINQFKKYIKNGGYKYIYYYGPDVEHSIIDTKSKGVFDIATHFNMKHDEFVKLMNKYKIIKYNDIH